MSLRDDVRHLAIREVRDELRRRGTDPDTIFHLEARLLTREIAEESPDSMCARWRKDAKLVQSMLFKEDWYLAQQFPKDYAGIRYMMYRKSWWYIVEQNAGERTIRLVGNVRFKKGQEATDYIRLPGSTKPLFFARKPEFANASAMKGDRVSSHLLAGFRLIIDEIEPKVAVER